LADKLAAILQNTEGCEKVDSEKIIQWSDVDCIYAGYEEMLKLLEGHRGRQSN
jgi:hypothetical protein